MERQRHHLRFDDGAHVGIRVGRIELVPPDAGLDDFRCVNAVARGAALGDPVDLRRAADWLVRLSRLPDEKLRSRMARRWTDVCERYAGPAEDVAALRAGVSAQIFAWPSLRSAPLAV